ncbi:MAG: hypothetical protein ACYTKD_09150 [Planctomycetota bacterium]|jgi:hypothetical protein
MNRYCLLSAALLVSAAGCNIPRLEVYAGTATESVAGELRADSSAGATGDTLDMEGDLGVADKSVPFDMRLVFAKGRGLFDASYSRRSIEESAVLGATKSFGGGTFDAGNTVASSLSLDEYRVALGLRAKSRDRKYIASARAGVLGADWSATLDDSDGDTATAAQLTLIPVVGAGLEVKMGPLASFVVEAEGMDIDVSDTKARLMGWGAGINISFVQAQLMLGYRSRSLDIEDEGERFALDTDGPTIAFQLQLSLNM